MIRKTGIATLHFQKAKLRLFASTELLHLLEAEYDFQRQIMKFSDEVIRIRIILAF